MNEDVKTTAPDARTFVLQLSQIHLFVIASAERADNVSVRPIVARFARRLAAEHADALNELIRAADGEGAADTASALDPSQLRMIQDLRTASAESLEGAFLQQQMEVLLRATELLERFAAAGDSSALRRMAGTVLPQVKGQFIRAKELASGMHGPS